MQQRRWLCAACEREWIESANACGADPWDPSMGCPGCRSAQIDCRTYTPVFPGSDIPRVAVAPVVAEPSVLTPTAVVQAPPHALTAEADQTDALAAQWEALCGRAGALT